METTEAFSGLECVDCNQTFNAERTTHRCPDCTGILDPTYDYNKINLTQNKLTDRPHKSMWRYEELLPFPKHTAVSMGEGNTALIKCPNLADAIGVDRVFLKDEGRNPTGTFKDRGQSAAITAAVQHGADHVALASAGNAGQAASAYAARAGLTSHAFLPERSGFTQKAMVEVHGGDLTVENPMNRDSEIGDAGRALETKLNEHDDWYPVQTFVTPYRHEGKKTMAYEITEQLQWDVPDAIIYPTGGGVGLVGMHKAAKEFQKLGLCNDLPSMYAAQSSGCAPIVEAWNRGRTQHTPWNKVDTICGGIAIPDPGASSLILEAIQESDGGAVATPDEAILDAAIKVAQMEGLELTPTAAAAVSGAFRLAEKGEMGVDDTIVLLNTGTGNKDADVLRSHLGDNS